jgi:hypothetical protein
MASEDILTDTPERALQRKFSGVVFRHYKGTAYRVRFFTRDHSNGEVRVVYCEAARLGVKVNWSRPWSEFSDRVEGVLRFRQLEGEELSAFNAELFKASGDYYGK